METFHLVKGSPKPTKEKGRLMLFSMKFCPFAQRVRIILKVKKIPHDIVNINLKNKPPWLFTLHPEGKVPALDTGTKILVESLAICDYLEETYPNPPLYPSDPEEKAKDLELIEKFDDILQLYYAILMNDDGKSLTEHAEVLLPLLQKYDNELSNRGNYFGGNTPNMVDYMIWPWAERAGIIDLIHKAKLPISDGDIPSIRSWCDRMRTLEPLKKIIISTDRHYKAWTMHQSGQSINYESI